MLYLFVDVRVIQKRVNQFLEKIVYSDFFFFIILALISLANLLEPNIYNM